MQQAERVVVVTNGASPDALRSAAGPGVAVVAADGGLEVAFEAGVEVALLVGDLDSIGPSTLAGAERRGIPVERHRPDKDASDLELALDAAAARGATGVIVVGSSGGRLDHLLAAALGLASERYADIEIDAVLGSARVSVIRGRRTILEPRGSLLTLLAVHGPAEGVVTAGLRYPLRGETLKPGSSRGVSNVFEAPEAQVSLDRGVLLAVRPGAETG